MQHYPWLEGRTLVLKMRERLALQTRLSRDIENEINRADPEEGYQFAVDDLRRKYPNSKARTTAASLKYDCHGLTFAARRSNIGAKEIEAICLDDDYVEIPKKGAMPGDIVIYRNAANGEVVHSGIVVSGPDGIGGPWIVSKWGECHEALHLLYDCPYAGNETRFYRVCK